MIALVAIIVVLTLFAIVAFTCWRDRDRTIKRPRAEDNEYWEGG
jgi:hypothetical protein